MIRVSTRLKVADNSGAKEIQCIKVLRSASYAYVGDIIVVSVKEAIPHGKVKRRGSLFCSYSAD